MRIFLRTNGRVSALIESEKAVTHLRGIREFQKQRQNKPVDNVQLSIAADEIFNGSEIAINPKVIKLLTQ